ncbi:MAG: DUF3369 domain-containing protein [Solirubrobacterales bacterium]
MADELNDELFPDEPEPETPASPAAAVATTPVRPPWKIMIVDDEPEVHRVTSWVLQEFAFEGRPLQIFNAYTATQSIEMLTAEKDIAVVLLDVVMETDDAGLRVVRYLREELHNTDIRIILRTGQPGQAPEQRVMVDYDINDYKEKTELTSQRLYTSLLAALRSYRDLMIINNSKRGLEQIIDSLSSLYEAPSLVKLAAGSLSQLSALLHMDGTGLYVRTSGIAATRQEYDEFHVLAASGRYEYAIGQALQSAVADPVHSAIQEALVHQHSMYLADKLAAYFSGKRGTENIIYLEGLHQLTTWEKNLVEIFCMNLSTAFDNIQLNDEIVATQKEIIFTLGEIAEARSHETGRHVKRVAEYARLLALESGLTEEAADLVWIASPIHDIGKLAVPDSILNKPGKLNPDEFEIIKTHSLSGYQMLRNSTPTIMKAAATIALQHHERWDGKGYPYGLEGENIDMFSRIVAVADVFDALSHERVYKKAWPIEDVINLFTEERGRQFDPSLVDVLLKNVDRMLVIKNDFPD